jgi:hypothetical protein
MKALLAFLLLFTLTVRAQQPLTNADVISLVKSGLSAEVVTAKIKRSAGNFDTSPSALRALKEAGVSEASIVAMIEADSGSAVITGVPAGAPRAATATLKDGTRVELELAYTVSSADLNEGDAVSFLVVQPVIVNGLIVIERGAPATARVVKAEGGKSWGRGGNLSWAIQHVTAADGQKIPLHYTAGTKGDGKPGSVTTGIVVTGLLFWPAAPLWGFKKGKPAVIPAGKRFEVFVHGDAEIATDKVPSRNTGATATRPEQRATEKLCVSNGHKVPCP